MVTIYVGPQRKTFTVHEELICDKINLFGKAFKGTFEEATTKKITLPEDDADYFCHVINWLYGEAFTCKKQTCKGVISQYDPGHILPFCAVYVLADKYGIEELGQQCVNACDTCLTALGAPLNEEEVTFIYKNFPNDCNLKTWAVRSIVEAFFSSCYYTFEMDPGSDFLSWGEFRGRLSIKHQEFEDDWKATIRDHLNISHFKDCDIHECRYHNRENFDFVFDD
jgi:hypothetical protein